MNYFSCFSGIEAASEAWRPLGWKPIGFSEIDPFASQLLAQRLQWPFRVLLGLAKELIMFIKFTIGCRNDF
jgi:site-specific DNA-cytosine methylase